MRGIMEQAQAKRTQPRKRIILGITGGIAAYKAAELVRLLIKQDFDVQVAMTEAATQFITPTTMQALSGQPVLLSQWQDETGMAHIHSSRVADAIVIAPATADFIAKLAHGTADDLLSTLCLARDCPLLVAPAMNKQMWGIRRRNATCSNSSPTVSRCSARPADHRPAARKAWDACWRQRNWPTRSSQVSSPSYSKA
jgi:flavoprotein